MIEQNCSVQQDRPAALFCNFFNSSILQFCNSSIRATYLVLACDVYGQLAFAECCRDAATSGPANERPRNPHAGLVDPVKRPEKCRGSSSPMHSRITGIFGCMGPLAGIGRRKHQVPCTLPLLRYRRESLSFHTSRAA